MLRPVPRERAKPPAGRLVPVGEVELYLLLGWALLEPCCSFVRMLAPPTEYLGGRGR